MRRPWGPGQRGEFENQKGGKQGKGRCQVRMGLPVKSRRESSRREDPTGGQEWKEASVGTEGINRTGGRRLGQASDPRRGIWNSRATGETLKSFKDKLMTQISVCVVAVSGEGGSGMWSKPVLSDH